jgi:putative mRNA 3-end processing factor
MGDRAPITGVDYGQTIDLNGVQVSFHPAGHILGSAQVRAEFRGEVWVISGDYKVAADATCAPFEPVRCHTFVTESTFGLPIFQWVPQAEIFRDMNAWWRENQAAGRASVLFAYALGKAQRILAGIDPTIGPIFTHPAVETCNADYRASGIALPPTAAVGDAPIRHNWSRSLILAPPSARNAVWKRKFGPSATAFASGWMCVRGALQRRGVDRGFVLSDHADWPDLLHAIAATGAERILVNHGYVAQLVRWLQNSGLDAAPLNPAFEGENDAGEMPELEEPVAK